MDLLVKVTRPFPSLIIDDGTYKAKRHKFECKIPRPLLALVCTPIEEGECNTRLHTKHVLQTDIPNFDILSHYLIVL